MDIEHISFSRKGVWDECQLKYKYKYHLKLPSEFPEPAHFGYGKTVHKVAEEFVKARGLRTVESIANDVLNGVILLEKDKKAPSLSGNYKEKFPKHIRYIVELTNRIGFDGEVEWKFDYNPFEDCIITGFIDRLIIRKDKYYIIDYKTTKEGYWQKNSNTVKKDLQLALYAKIVQHFFNAKAENIQAALVYLEGSKYVSTKFTQDILDEAENQLVQTYLDIKKTEPDQAQGRLGNHCRFCDWKLRCPLYSLI